MFREVVEKKISDPQGRLTRLIKSTTGEVRELVKPFIHDNPKYGYERRDNMGIHSGCWHVTEMK